MRQVWITRAGGPEVLQVREAPDPEPAAGQVRIRVAASGINFADIMGRMGLYPDLPAMPVVVGYEVAGQIDAVGDGLDTALLGRDVIGLTRFGGYADVLCIPADQMFFRPAGMSVQQGAAIPVNYLTAYMLIVAMGGLRAGETVLVHSAGGGVGIAAIQLAKHIGATVIGTASANKHEALRAMGVDHLIDYREDDFAEVTRALTGGKGVELILDPIGGESLRKGFGLLAPSGRIGAFGMSAVVTGRRRSIFSILGTVLRTPWLTFNPARLMNENRGIFGVNIGHMWGEVPRLREWTEELLALYARGVVQPRVDETFRFDQAGQAHQYIQDRRNLGKVLLVP